MNLPASGSDGDLAKALPAHLRSCHITPLKLDGNLSGAALVFPAAPVVSGAAVINREADKQLQAATSMIVGESETLLAAIDVACRVARSSGVTSLLIEGETGVGKELFARLVHAGSGRSENDPFIALNCGAITRELFGSELFGHVAGALPAPHVTARQAFSNKPVVACSASTKLVSCRSRSSRSCCACWKSVWSTASATAGGGR
jgi:sigma54-dependent transcription regulator